MSEPATGREHETPVAVRAVSATERAAFRRCRRQWFLQNVHMLEPMGEGNTNFWLGDLVHWGLEVYYRSIKAGLAHAAAVDAALDAYQARFDESLEPIKKELGWLWDNYAPDYRETGGMGFEMLQGYFEREEVAPAVDEVLEVERRLFVPIKSPAGRRVGTLTVRADLTGTRKGRRAVVDHKTAAGRASSGQLDLDDQLTAEVYAEWRATGVFPAEAVYNVLIKRVARPPKQIKGTKSEPVKLSKDKDQPTTYDLYVAEIRRLGLDLSAYSDILSTLRDAEMEGSKFFQREAVFRTPGQMAQFEANLYEEFRDMKAVAAHPERAYPSPSVFNCSGCEVKAVCIAMMDGNDAGAVIQATLAVGEPRY